jgi:uncharacterized protein YdhG (YjbR/CyaY superfamily)
VTRGQRSAGLGEVDAYLADLPEDTRDALQELRKTIRAAAPMAEEVVSYRMPAFRQDGMLVWYAGFRDHCSFFVGSTVVLRKFAHELRPFARGKGTLRFTPQQPLPEALVRRIVRARVAENAGRAAKKNRKAMGSARHR